jgi:hypothetical protein
VLPFDIADLLERLRAGIALVPPALWAVIMLTGPTAAWLLYRFVVAPRSIRVADEDLSTMWVCPSCRSVNELRLDRCYRCDARPIEDELEVIEAIPVGPSPLVAVGPGLDLDQPARVPPGRREPATAMGHRPAADGAEVTPDGDALDDARPMGEAEEAGEAARRRRTPRRAAVPVGPGRPDVGSPRRAVVAGQRPASDDPPAA